MATLLTLITLVVRLISPHTVIPALQSIPLVPGLTGLMLVSAVIAGIRRRLSLLPPLYLYFQVALLVWMAFSLVMAGEAGHIPKLGFINDLFFGAIVALVIDRLPRFKLFVVGYAFSLVVISGFGVQQIRAPRVCAEVVGGELLFDTRACAADLDCYQKMPPREGAPAAALRGFKCERKGPFGVAAFQGRMRWVGPFTDSNALGTTCATIAPILIAWAFTFKKKRRLLKFALTAGVLLALMVIILGTGSRGSLVGLFMGLGVTLWRLLGKKVVIIGIVLVVVAGAVLTVTGKSPISRGDETSQTGTEASDQSRTTAMAVGMRLWFQYPVVGVGAEQITKYHYLEAHNGFISAASELGTIGLCLFVFTIWLNFRLVFAARQHALRKNLGELATISAGTLGGVLAGSFAFTVFLSNYATLNNLMLCLLAGGLFKCVQQESPELKLKLSHWDVLGALLLTGLIMGLTHLALSAYFTMKGFPLQFDTSSGKIM